MPSRSLRPYVSVYLPGLPIVVLRWVMYETTNLLFVIEGLAWLRVSIATRWNSNRFARNAVPEAVFREYVM